MTAQLGDLKGVIRAKEGLIKDLTKAGKESEEVRRRLERKLGEFERELRRTQRDLFSAQSILRRVEKTSTADSDSTSLHLDYKKNVDKYKKQVCFHNVEVNVISNFLLKKFSSNKARSEMLLLLILILSTHRQSTMTCSL